MIEEMFSDILGIKSENEHISSNLIVMLLKSAHVSVTLGRYAMDQEPLVCEDLLMSTGSLATIALIGIASYSIHFLLAPPSTPLS